ARPDGDRPDPSPDGGPPNGGPRGPRGGLRVVAGTATAVAEPAASYAETRDDAGPRRLRIVLEETADVAADRRRIRRICAALDRCEGDALPVELAVRRRDGSIVRMNRGCVAPDALERLVPELRALIGVLGEVREAGVEAAPVAAAVGG